MSTTLYTDLNNGLGLEILVTPLKYTSGQNMYADFIYTVSAYGTTAGTLYGFRISLNSQLVYEAEYSNFEVSPGDGVWASSSYAMLPNNTVQYNYDGTCSVTMTVDAKINYNSAVYNCSVTQEIELDPFDLKSNISFPSTAIGEEATIYFYKKNPDYLVTLTYSYQDELSGTIVEKTADSSVTWTVPDDFYTVSGMSSSKTGSASLTMTTYDSAGNVVDILNSYFNFYVDEAKCKPEITTTVIQTGYSSVLGDYASTYMIKYYNTVSWTVSAKSNYGASISSYSLINGKNRWVGQTSGTIYNSESNQFIFTVTDSRGISTTKTVVLNFLDYTKLTCNLSVSPISTAGATTITITGNVWKGSFPARGINGLTVKYRYTPEGGTAGGWLTAASSNVSISGNSYTAEINITGLDYTKTYTFEATATDYIGTITAKSVSIVSKPVFDWSSDDFNFNVPVNINGALTINGQPISSSGSSSGSSDPGFTTGTWEPIVSSINSLQYGYGGYIRMGDFCILNWCAYGPVSSTTMPIYISNLPFYPDDTILYQAGGGFIDGAISSNDGAFSGWSIANYGSGAHIYAYSGPVTYWNGDYIMQKYASQTMYATSDADNLYVSGTIMYKVADGE